MRTTRRIFGFGTLFAASLLAARAGMANDRDLLYAKKAYPPDILILVANTESMATCIPGDDALPNGQTCPTLTTGLGSYLAPFGIGDSPYSKMGKAKSAIGSIIAANPTTFYFGLTSESYSRQTARTGTTKRYTFLAKESSFCDGSSGGLYWACTPAGTAANFGPSLLSSGSVTTLTDGGKTYEVIPIGGLPAGGTTYDYTANVGNETWITSYGGDVNHQPYLVNSSTKGMILTNPTGNTTADKGNAQNQELVITFSSTTATSANPYRIHQCSTNCTLSDSNFDGQKFTVQKKIVECPSSSSTVTSVSVTKAGSGYTSVPTVSITGGGGSGATATASLSVVSLTVTATGNNYTSTPTCTVSGGGATTQATCTVTISGKKINKVVLGTGGTGYTSVPTVTITGGGGSGGKVTASLGVGSLTLTSGGSGFTSTPTVSFAGGGGSGATATAVLTSTTGSYPCNPSTGTQKGNTVTVDYVVPPLPSSATANSSIADLLTYCSESDSTCSYPMIYGYGSTNAAVGEEMGWIYYADADVSGNQSGWITNPSSNPQPMVMIPHAYTPWKSYPGPIQYPSASQYSGNTSVSFQYTQSSVPCINRSFRPLSAILDNSDAHTQKDNYPVFAPATTTTDGSSNLSSSECDTMIDGLWQTQFFKNNGGTTQNEIAPIVFPAGHNGSGLDIVKMLTNTYQYFNGGNNGCSAAGSYVDGFCGGTRPDDPYKSCRLSAVILVTDSFTGSSPDFQFGSSSDPTSQLKAIGVPVFVIGFAMAPNSKGTCPNGITTLPDGTTNLNTGQCIAYYSGATTFQGTTQTRQGYYPVDSATDLGAALQAVLNTLNTATRDFATATIPSVSATSAGIAYLSQFNPRNNRSIWEGHLRAYFLDPTTGLVKAASGTGLPDPTKFSFWTGSTPATGSLIWDAGGSGSDTPTIFGNLDGIRFVDPTLLLTDHPGAGGAWSDSTHDQQTSYPGGGIGRNVFFGLRPGDPGCTSTTYECLTQIPVGAGGVAPTPTLIGSGGDYASVESSQTGGAWSVSSPPSTLPTWWSTVQGSNYVNVPSSPLEGSGQQSKALQNSFSFVRGNRDPVVEAFKISSKFDATHTDCGSLADDLDSPCYYGDILGDLFHSNPSIQSAPTNFRYYFSQDPNTASPGMYSDRGKSYQTFYSDHAHRRKILYVGGDDGALHAFDVGVYNGDQSTYDPGTGSICPLCNKFDFGSGREIFAYVPRAGLNKIYNLAHTLTYNWTIDGPPSIDDVYIDVTRVSGSAQGVAPSGSTTDSDVSGASPTSTSHAWRTVLVGSEREGGLTGSPDGGGITNNASGNGGSVFALDITDPDQTNHMKSSDSGGHTGVPECVVSDFDPATASTPSNCTAPFPRILWEIRDDQSTTTTAPFPTELSTSTNATTQDLGMTWSQPITGKVKISVSSSPRDFFVAIFGGGYDHTAASLSATNASGNTGNFLYMVDIETGKIIYKKNLGVWSAGASSTSTAGNLTAGVPGSPAVIDINNDGYLDFVYIGDTQGRLWKVDMTASASLDSTTKRVADGNWNPVMFFDEYLNSTAQGTSVRQPIFDRPSAFFAGNTSTGAPKIGIAFGTGDRDNMPILTDTNANFFVVVVDPPSRSQAVNNDHPLTLADLTVASLTANNCTSTTCLNANGYYVTLPTGSSGAQIVNTDPLVFNQQIFFNTFLHTTIAGNCNEIGVPYIYILNYQTGESAQTDANGNIVANTTGPSGAEVLSTDIIYSAGGGANASATNTTDTGAKVNVTSSADSTAQDPVKTGLSPTVKIKSWKEE